MYNKKDTILFFRIQHNSFTNIKKSPSVPRGNTYKNFFEYSLKILKSVFTRRIHCLNYDILNVYMYR